MKKASEAVPAKSVSQVGSGSIAAASRQFLFLVKSETLSSQTSCFLANGPPPPQKITSHIVEPSKILSLLFSFICTCVFLLAPYHLLAHEIEEFVKRHQPKPLFSAPGLLNLPAKPYLPSCHVDVQ